MYDYVIIGSGLFGSVFAHQATKRGKKCLVVEKRDHIGGNCATIAQEGVTIHRYGAHIFHTSNETVWSYVTSLCDLTPFINSPVALWHHELYNLPFNMNTFHQLWGVITPAEAQAKLDSQRIPWENPTNLEEQALALAGRDIYEKLIKSYTEKQWGRPCTELPPFIIRRVPLRMRYDNNYFNDPHQGIPSEGYSALIERMLTGSDVVLGEDYNLDRKRWDSKGKKVLYTGMLDALFDYQLGKLEYRSEKFITKRLMEENHQGVAVINYTSMDQPYTRSIEHKHFLGESSPVTYVSYEYPADYQETGEPYYPVADQANLELYRKYRALAETRKDFLFGGRLAGYAYMDMDKTIASALTLVNVEFGD
ncbi:MAG: UDP-galactopyranose mutase [Sphaerochaeta sp.]|jgi:UDP-galactopyranose mutase|nr:UDP-galactopyranose mutase [Sphaerochaeta sp.]MCH3920421.1 UDP-galactopyranose mutase [Sphaerochaeta sp.]MCI2045721.1 UDP-galactopyranose mutase [Sphaerochaeta sp.]MCI2096568.1 UDP-galactopyranose mutase [Sphaerochaeta sp.]MCI2105008.1 UDP-galactopyranose mutase [Sphaerochaeta sp.]